MSRRNCRGAWRTGRFACWLGEFVAARALPEQCHGLGDPAHHATDAGLTGNPYAVMLARLALTLAYLGYVDQARSRLNEAFSEAHRLKYAQTLGDVLVLANWIEVITCSPEIQRHSEELLGLSTEHGLQSCLGYAIVFRGLSLTACGQAQEGLTLGTRGLVALRATGAVLNTSRALVLLAERYAMIGQPIEGLHCLAEAAQIIEMTEERHSEAELHRLRGDLLNAIGDRAVAEQSYHEALAVAKRQSARTLELRTATSLARLWRDRGKRTEARDLLAPIYGWFTEVGFDTPVRQGAKAALDQLA